MDTQTQIRGQYVHARVGPAERAALERLCQHEALRLSEVMRLLVREGAKARGLWPTQPAPAERGVTK